MKRVMILAVILSFTAAAAGLMATTNLNLRFKESVNGLMVNVEDLQRIISGSTNVAKLPGGNYEINLYLWRTPLFYLGDLSIEKYDETARQVKRQIRWNENFKDIDDRYMLVSSVPEFEWVHYPLSNCKPFKLMFYDKSSRHISLMLEIEGSLKRDININN
jgi:hypothetical protein